MTNDANGWYASRKSWKRKRVIKKFRRQKMKIFYFELNNNDSYLSNRARNSTLYTPFSTLYVSNGPTSRTHSKF